MKEFIVELWGNGPKSAVRVFASNAAEAVKNAKKLHPDRQTGKATEVK